MLSTKLSELVGIILGDGSINIYESTKYSTYYRLKITIHSEELQYIEYIRNLIYSVFKEVPIIKKRKNENATDIFIFKKIIILNLLKLGLVKSPKWNRAIIPLQFLNKKNGKFVLRGYFDTDGCVVLTKNHEKLYPRLEMKISPSPMLKQFESLLKLYGFKFHSYDIGKGEIRIQMNGKNELEKWKNIIGFSNRKHLKKCDKL